MAQGRLTDAQAEALKALAGVTPRWRLVGGGALGGFHTQHRGTRDLDLFWNARELGTLDAECVRRLSDAGFTTSVLQRHPTFCRLRAALGAETVVVDLVAEPLLPGAEPEDVALGPVRILVDGRHEILVSKLCALLSRSELRDLEDVRALLQVGEDLGRAMADAPKKDAGFSPLTFAWILEQLPIAAMGRALGRSAEDVRSLEEFRAGLVAQVLALARPA